MVQLITARKRSLGKVIFSQASVCPQGGLCPQGGSLSRGEYLSGGVSVQRGSLSGGLCQGDPRTVTYGRYASYWNAFLFQLIVV